MPQLSREEIQEIVSRDLQGYRLAEPPSGAEADMAPAASVPVEASTPDLDALRRKYSGEPTPSPAPPVSQDIGGEPDIEDAIVTVVPAHAVDPASEAARPKTVVVSGRHRRVVGSQG